ncbi:MAG: papain-like cysteine protease family protein [Massilia sp.]
MKILHDVAPVKQPSTMSCWAATTTMLVNWKLGIHRSIDAVVAQAGPRFTAIYQSSFAVPPQGIGAADEQELYKALGLKVFQGTNYTIDGWFDPLAKHGPLSITVDADPGKNHIHALVLIGLDGDGTSGATITSYIDPAHAARHDVFFGDFIKLYEGSANWPLQVVCNP